MWKWTDATNVKVIILDADFLNVEYLDFDYCSVLPSVKVLMVKNNPSAYGVEYNNQTDRIEYFDIISLLLYIILEYNCESYSLIAISNNNHFLKEMIQNHIGTIIAGDLLERDFKNISDFTTLSLKKLSNILNQRNTGYFAEVLAIGGTKNRTSLIANNKNIILSNGEEKQLALYFGGRYYPTKRKFYVDDPLSMLIRNFKQRYITEIDDYFDEVIDFINGKEKIDFLSYSPLKPKEIEEDRFNRFISLKLLKSKEKGIQLQSLIECIKDFSQKANDYYHRKEVVKDAYKVCIDISGKHVVILDDVYSTGSTIEEIAKMLYENGAQKVTAILIAVNQMIESTSLTYKHSKCKICGGEMILKISKNNKLFFGCVKYKEGCYSTLGCIEGLQEIKLINKFEQFEISDLDDLY